MCENGELNKNEVNYSNINYLSIMSHRSNLNSYYIKSYLAYVEAGIHFISNTHKKRRFYFLFCKECNIIITLIRHTCNMFMLKKVNRSDFIGPIDHCFEIWFRCAPH